MNKIDWRLCLVADMDAAMGRDLTVLVSEAVAGGVTCVQLRAKHMNGGPFLLLAERLTALLNPKNIPLIINDRVDVAAAGKCQGVHLGQDDLPVSAAREILGKKAVIGVSVNTVEEARTAEKEGADYLGAGPVFTTSSKETSLPVLGTGGLILLRHQVNIPVLAIGGIDSRNAPGVFNAGADGIAVISAILGPEETRAAAYKLARILPPVN
jgi:thiamine-phosphate pyrophosphorylase